MKLPLAARFLLHLFHFCSAQSLSKNFNLEPSRKLILGAALCPLLQWFHTVCLDEFKRLSPVPEVQKRVERRAERHLSSLELSLWRSAELPVLCVGRERLQRVPPSLSFPAARGKRHLCGSRSCWTVMGTCLRSFHRPPLATGPLKMTSCCLPVVSLVLGYR